MKKVAHGTVIQNDHLAQIWLNAAQVLDIRSIPERAVLPVISSHKEFPLQFEPVNDRIRIFLHRGGENDQFVPLAHFAEEFVAMRALMDIVQDRVLRPNHRGRLSSMQRAEGDGRVQLDFDHVARRHAATFGERVNQSFVEVDDERLLRRD